MPTGSILVADDDAAIRTVLNQALSRAGYEVRSTGNAATLWRWISQGEGDLVITDVVMPDENAFDLLPRIKKPRPDLPIIVMSAQNTFMTAIRASERGAYEYLPKPFDLKELIAIVGRALSEPKEKRPAAVKPEDFDNIPLVGRSPAMQEIYRVLARLMQTDLTVMISGESGTGKELVARALHDYGKRRAGTVRRHQHGGDPARPHRVGIVRPREGRLHRRQRAHRPAASSRPKAARCSSTRSATCRWRRRPGCCACCSRANTPPSAAARRSRATCASSRPPTRTCGMLIQQGLFREDLFFRLNVVPLRLPPLRERTEDIPDLIRHFFAQAEREGLPPQADRPGGARPAQAPPLARQCARTGEPRPPAGRALSAGDHHRGGDRAGAGAAGDCRSAREEPRRGGIAERRGRAAPRRLFRRVSRRPPAAGPLSPHPARGRIPAAVGGARRHPRQPDPRRRPARRQPQHAAQENPRSRYQGFPAAADRARPICGARAPRNCRNSATLLYKCISAGAVAILRRAP